MGYARKTVPESDMKDLIKDGRKKFVKVNEGALLYSMGVNSFRVLAKEAGAFYKLKKSTLVNVDLVDEYLEHFREEY